MATSSLPDRAETSRYHHGDLRRALVNAGINLLTETGRWEFSLREVARRAEVSHNAPYAHFDDKRDLLAAIAVAGFEALREEMRSSTTVVMGPVEALGAIGAAYVRFGLANSAHYRLMFGSALMLPGQGLPAGVMAAATASRALLRDVIQEGVRAKIFRAGGDGPDAIAAAVLSAWSLVHGLTTLCIDGLAEAEVRDLPAVIDDVLVTSLFGLVERAPAAANGAEREVRPTRG